MELVQLQIWPSLPGPTRAPFYSSTGGNPSTLALLSPFNIILRKSLWGLWSSFLLHSPLETLIHKEEFPSIWHCITNRFAELRFIFQWLIANPPHLEACFFTFWQNDRDCWFTFEPILGRTLDSRVPQGKQKPYVKGTSATQKQSVPSAANTKSLHLFVFFPQYRKESGFKNIASILLEI